MLGGSASGGSLRWNDPDRFHGYDLSRSGAAPQAVEPMMGIPAAFHKGAFGASAVAWQRRISIRIRGPVAQQPRAGNAYRQHHGRADENAWLRPAMGKTITIDHRSDGLAQVKGG
jgi:hypothetical protein